MCRKLFLLVSFVLVLGLASAAGAYPEADFEDLTVGSLAGQAGGTGWAAGWDSVGLVNVVQETGNKFIRYAADSTEEAHRDITGFTSAAYSFTFRMRFENCISTWPSRTGEIQYRNGSIDPIHVKFEGGGNGQWFRVGNENMLHVKTIHDETLAGTWGGGAEADYWKDPVGSDWVNIWLAVDADAADKANAIAVFWELNNGSMGLVGLGTIQLGDETTLINDLKTAFNAGTSNSIDLDDLNIVDGLIPEPATIALLGLGGLALLRRRRAH